MYVRLINDELTGQFAHTAPACRRVTFMDIPKYITVFTDSSHEAASTETKLHTRSGAWVRVGGTVGGREADTTDVLTACPDYPLPSTGG